ncbi:MAG: DNA polymerase III subunit chi, partial [Rhodoferax sp.]|nr:DNA polymerase III subunit chi [Rhodoferax sp.]
TLAALDTALWTFDAQDFVPHVRWPAPAVVAARTPIWLCGTDADLPQDAPRVRVNIGTEAFVSADGVDRMIEIVGLDADDRAAGRARWRHYEQDWGVKPTHYAAS